jgi:hypothetical protein
VSQGGAMAAAMAKVWYRLDQESKRTRACLII